MGIMPSILIVGQPIGNPDMDLGCVPNTPHELVTANPLAPQALHTNGLHMNKLEARVECLQVDPGLVFKINPEVDTPEDHHEDADRRHLCHRCLVVVPYRDRVENREHNQPQNRCNPLNVPNLSQNQNPLKHQ